jgi:hypothetical protein
MSMLFLEDDAETMMDIFQLLRYLLLSRKGRYRHIFSAQKIKWVLRREGILVSGMWNTGSSYPSMISECEFKDKSWQTKIKTG